MIYRLVPLLLALLLAGPARAESTASLRVITTFSILDDVVRQVAGDAAKCSVVVEAGGDSHTFQPSPKLTQELAQADLIVENGLGLEPWLDKLYVSSGSKAKRVVATTGIRLLTVCETTHDHSDHAGHHHHDSEADPHHWHDVTNMIVVVGNVRDALCAADPATSAAYAKRATALMDRYSKLDTWAKAEVAKLPADKRKLVTTHDSLGYLARRYEFKIVNTALGTATTESAEPSARQMSKVVSDIKQSGVRAIFAESTHTSKVMETLAAETGVVLAPPLYTDSLSSASGPAGSYEDLMRYNISTIVNALSGP